VLRILSPLGLRCSFIDLYSPKGHRILSVAFIDGDNPKNRFYRECRLNECQTFDPFSLK
jgi:hypothetical protein